MKVFIDNFSKFESDLKDIEVHHEDIYKKMKLILTHQADIDIFMKKLKTFFHLTQLDLVFEKFESNLKFKVYRHKCIYI